MARQTQPEEQTASITVFKTWPENQPDNFNAVPQLPGLALSRNRFRQSQSVHCRIVESLSAIDDGLVGHFESQCSAVGDLGVPDEIFDDWRVIQPDAFDIRMLRIRCFDDQLMIVDLHD